MVNILERLRARRPAADPNPFDLAAARLRGHWCQGAVGRFLDPTEPVCARGAIAAVSNDASLYRILNDVSFREHGVNSSEFNDLPTTKEKDVLHLFASAGVEFGRRAASAADEGRYG